MSRVTGLVYKADPDPDDPHLPRWYLDITIPGERSVAKRATWPGALVNWADQWAADRKTVIELTFIGGWEAPHTATKEDTTP